MAEIRATIDAPCAPAVAFDHVADFTTASDWDPQVVGSVHLDPPPIGLGSRFAVRLDMGRFRPTLTYEITTYQRPYRVVLDTRSAWHVGRDDVRFAPDGDGTQVEWRAAFRLRGPARLLDPLLAIGFRRTGGRAVAGLEAALKELPAARAGTGEGSPTSDG